MQNSPRIWLQSPGKTPVRFQWPVFPKENCIYFDVFPWLSQPKPFQKSQGIIGDSFAPVYSSGNLNPTHLITDFRTFVVYQIHGCSRIHKFQAMQHVIRLNDDNRMSCDCLRHAADLNSDSYCSLLYVPCASLCTTAECQSQWTMPSGGRFFATNGVFGTAPGVLRAAGCSNRYNHRRSRG